MPLNTNIFILNILIGYTVSRDTVKQERTTLLTGYVVMQRVARCASVVALVGCVGDVNV